MINFKNYTMLTILRTLYNNGENDGDIIIKTINEELRGHSFILKKTSDFFRICMSDPYFAGIIEIDSTSKIINIVINYLYSEKIIDDDLSPTEIIQLYNVINNLKCHQSITILKNYYLQKFPKLLNQNNWIELLTYTFNISKYTELQEELLTFYTNYILNNIQTIDLHTIDNLYKPVNDEIKNILFSIALQKVYSLTNEIKNNTSQQENITKHNLNTFLINASEYEEAISEEYVSESEEEIITPIQKNKMIKKVVKCKK